MASALTPSEKRLQIADLKDGIKRASESFGLFLAGPFIMPEEADSHPENSKTTAKSLRYFLNKNLDSDNSEIYLGEDHRLRLGGEKHYGEHNNAVLFERHYIKHHLDAVIILPSSTGSFCEFGDWASDEKICPKMLIIVDKQYELSANYLNEGPIKLALDNFSIVKYIDYEDKERCFHECQDFLSRVKSKIRARKLYDRD